MDSQQGSEVAGVGVEMYSWMLGALSCANARGGGYRRLNQPVRKRVRLARLGKRRIRALNIKRLPRLRLRLRLRWFSPFHLLAKLRDAYVKFLQAASDRIAFPENFALSPFAAAAPPDGFSRASLKAREAEMDKVLQLYLSRNRPSPQLLLTHDD